MSVIHQTIAFSAEEHQKLKCLSQFHNRSMVGHIREMIKLDYEEMQRNLD